jgi:quinol monooxygenase YgiN
MLKRIVKMTFREEKVPEFMAIFEDSKRAIRQFHGCMHLELWRHHSQPHILFTYSHWADANALAQYRQSALFAKTWQATKALFAEKAEAWSVEGLDYLP